MPGSGRKPSSLFFALLAAACLLLFIVPTGASTPVYGPGPVFINESGTYELMNDVTDGSGDSLIVINASDVVFDGRGHTIHGMHNQEGTGILVNPEGENQAVPISNVTIRNTHLDNWTYGILFIHSRDSAVQDVAMTGNEGDIFLLNNCTENTISGNTFSDSQLGIVTIDFCTSNTISDNTFTGSLLGIYMIGDCDLNTISENTFTDNMYGLALLSESNNNIVKGNSITNSTICGLLIEGGSDNTIYNNRFNSLQNVFVAGPEGTNLWNIDRTAGPNIMGGPSIGGNFWGTPDGTGFSQTDPDINNDGFCDDPYTLGTGNIDHSPLRVWPPTVTAGFYAFGHVGQAPYLVRFLDQSIGSPTAWKWDFGDGNTSTEQSPTHVYNQTGAYNVALTASSGWGSDTAIQYRCIIVNTVPAANFTANATSGSIPFTAQFTDQSSGATGYQWEFGDGTTSTEQSPVHTYTVPGSYTVTLVVSASDYGSVFKQKVGYITVTDPPTVGFSTNVTAGLSPLAVQFNESVNGSVQYYYWLFGDGSASLDQNPVHVYDTAGKYTVSLYAIGSNGTQVKTVDDCINVTSPVTPTPTVTATVTPAPTEQYLPAANFTVTPQGGAGSMGILVTDTSVNATSVQYDLGDGTTTTYPDFRYTYWQAGTYTIKQTATSAVGSSTKNVTVTVPATTPTITFPPIGGDQGSYTIHCNVDGATVLFDQITKGTIADGILKIQVYTTGTPYRTYTVQKDGYTTVSGAITDHPGKDQNVDITVNLTAASGQTPYNGPHTIPGTLQAEDYDLGGEGVAYHDTTRGNEGGVYRQDDVDIEVLDTDRSPNVGWIRSGEWLTYTVNVSTAGTYDAGFRVASSHAGSSVQVYLDAGTTPVATVNVPNTGDWPVFRTISVPVTLPAGIHRLKLTFPTDYVNINWISFARGGA